MKHRAGNHVSRRGGGARVLPALPHLVCSILLGVLTLAGASVPAAAPALAAAPVAGAWGADPVGCSYGTTGAAAGLESNVCWINTSGWTFTPGTTSAVRTVSMGAYRLTFAVKVTATADLLVRPGSTPTWSGAALGSTGYRGIGTSAFQTTSQEYRDATETISLTGLSMTNTVTGQTQSSGWGIAMADAESTNANDLDAEVLTMSSNVPIRNLLQNRSPAYLAPVSTPASPCTISGFGTSTVTCTGTGLNSSGAYIGYAPAPSSATIALTTKYGSAQGGAFGVVIPQLTFAKSIAARAQPADQFSLGVKQVGSGAAVGAATTRGTATSATTGLHVVQAGNYSLTESAVGGTDLTLYRQSWSCTDPSGLRYGSLPDISGTGGEVTLAEMQSLSCTVTNTPIPPTLTLIKSLPSRYASGDQAQVAIKNGGTTVDSATTAGSATSATTAVKVVTSGTAYTLTDTMAPGSLANYAPSLACTNSRTASTTTLPSGPVSSATVTPVYGDVITCTYTNNPRSARIDLAKTVGAVSGPTDGVFTVPYTITVTNNGNGAGTYGPLTDTPGASSGIVITNATVSGQVSIPNTGPIANGTTYVINSGSTVLDAGETHTYTVLVRFTVTGPTTACTGSPGGGLYNAAAIGGGQESGPATNNSACANVPGSVDVKKTGVSVGPVNAAGDFVATYSVSATNNGGASTTYGPITDTPSFASGLAVTALSWTGPAGTSGTPTSSTGSYVVGSSRTLAAGATETYVVRVTFHYVGTTQASACAGPGTGTYNAVTATGESGPTTNNAACLTPPAPPTQSLTMTKSVASITDTNVSGFNDAGDVVRYSFAVTNTGVTTLAPATITDPLLGLSGWQCAASVAPGSTVTCAAPAGYVITASDATAGTVRNTATATATPPYTPAITTVESFVDTRVASWGSAAVAKKDTRTDAGLSGARFALYSTTASSWTGSTMTPPAQVCQSVTTTGSPIRTGITTDGTGRVTIGQLRLSNYDYSTYTTTTSGSYTVYCLVETQAPAGYSLAAEPISFVVSSASTPAVVTVTDTLVNLANALPVAGGLGADGIPFAGIGLLAAGLVGALLQRRRAEPPM